MRLKTGIGETLRSKREELGLTYEQVENETKIRAKFIEALENEDYKTIPGEVYVKGFLKAYAEMLGLPGDSILTAYKGQTGQLEEEVAPPVERPKPQDRQPKMEREVPERFERPVERAAYVPEPPAERPKYDSYESDVRFSTRVSGTDESPRQNSRGGDYASEARPMPKPRSTDTRPGAARPVAGPTNKNRRVKEKPKKHKSSLIMGLVLVVAIGGTGYLSWKYMGGNNNEQAAAPVKEETKTVKTHKPAKSTDTQSSMVIDDQTSTATSQSALTGSQTSEAALQQGKLDMTLEIVGSPCWVSVKTDGKSIVNKTLEPGAQMSWTVNEAATVKLGNAGAAKITVNGADIGKLGENGSIYKKEFKVNSGGLN